MRVLVCGGRDFSDVTLLRSALDAHHEKSPITLLIHGAAPGADTLAGEWAEAKGIPVSPFPANWKVLGRAAGPIRNKQMLDDGRPNLVIAMPGGRGTANMVNQAKAAGLPVKVIGEEETNSDA
jgi:hypothetical protein